MNIQNLVINMYNYFNNYKNKPKGSNILNDFTS